MSPLEFEQFADGGLGSLRQRCELFDLAHALRKLHARQPDEVGIGGQEPDKRSRSGVDAKGPLLLGGEIRPRLAECRAVFRIVRPAQIFLGDLFEPDIAALGKKLEALASQSPLPRQR